MIVVGIDPCVYPEYATKQNLSHIKGRPIGLPLRHKFFQIKQKPFIDLVDQILKKKKQNPSADTEELESNIKLRYSLLSLQFLRINLKHKRKIK